MKNLTSAGVKQHENIHNALRGFNKPQFNKDFQLESNDFLLYKRKILLFLMLELMIAQKQLL